MSEALEELAISTVAEVTAAKRAVYPFNDFGSVLGAQDDIEAIYDDLQKALRSARCRAARLQNRINKWNAGDRQVSMLRKPERRRP